MTSVRQPSLKPVARRSGVVPRSSSDAVLHSRSAASPSRAVEPVEPFIDAVYEVITERQSGSLLLQRTATSPSDPSSRRDAPSSRTESWRVMQAREAYARWSEPPLLSRELTKV